MAGILRENLLAVGTIMKNILYLCLLLLIFPLCKTELNSVHIFYYGHSCFEFYFEGYRILIDPFTPEWFDYELPRGQFDMVFSTHDAKDHASFEGLNIDKLFLASGAADEFKMISNGKLSIQKGRITEYINKKKFTFRSVASYHDEVQGQKNGVNGIVCFDFCGIKIVHMGDIGHVLTETQVNKIGRVDILMIPVDSYYIIELEKAREIVKQLSPTLVIPMHYKTEKSSNKAYENDLENFARMFDTVSECRDYHIVINEQMLNVNPRLFILEYLKKID